jgi:5-methylthioadenosine/S-adenosylhomocysteine deaminase
LIVENLDYVVTMDDERRILRDAFLVVENGVIASLGLHARDTPPPGHETLDGKGLALFPGLVNTHTHSFQSLIRGLGDDRVLKDWLHDVTLPAAAGLRPDHAYAGALLTFAMSVASGVTTTLDYAYALPSEGVADAIIRASNRLGIRLVFGRGVADTGEKYGIPDELTQDVTKSLKDIDRLTREFQRNGMVRIWASPLTMWAVSREGLMNLSDFVEQRPVGVTVHMEETPFDVTSAIDNLGEKALRVLQSTGLLKNRLLAVHCVYVDEEDLQIMRTHGVAVSHNPLSNMYLSSGIAPVPTMLENRLCVGIGLDGPASNNSQDMLEGLKTTALLHKVANPGKPTILTASKVLEMATIDGAMALGLDREVGSVEAGKKADFFLLDLHQLDTCPCYDPVSTLVYAASKENIRRVYINGVEVWRDGSPTQVGRDEIIESANSASQDLVGTAGIRPKD